MKIAALKVGAARYRVEEWDGVEARDDEARGDHNYRRGIIRIAKGYTDAASADALVHETLHALLADTGLDLGEWEETLVESLAPRLTAFLADNPDAIRTLLRMLK